MDREAFHGLVRANPNKQLRILIGDREVLTGKIKPAGLGGLCVIHVDDSRYETYFEPEEVRAVGVWRDNV